MKKMTPQGISLAAVRGWMRAQDHISDVGGIGHATKPKCLRLNTLTGFPHRVGVLCSLSAPCWFLRSFLVLLLPFLVYELTQSGTDQSVECPPGFPLLSPFGAEGQLSRRIHNSRCNPIDLLLGLDFRWICSRSGRWMPLRMPPGRKRTALLRRLKGVFRRFCSQPVGRFIDVINPILRGCVHDFAWGHSSRCFSYVRR